MPLSVSMYLSINSDQFDASVSNHPCYRQRYIGLLSPNPFCSTMRQHPSVLVKRCVKKRFPKLRIIF